MSEAKAKAKDHDQNPDEPQSPADEDAIDDSEDLNDADLKEIQETETRRRQSIIKSINESPLSKILPFPFLPNLRPLTSSDLESCVALENAAFARPEHRASREKFEYRLSACPELCLGLFATVVPSTAAGLGVEPLIAAANPVESGRADGAVSVLFAAIVATKTSEAVVTDQAMDYPRDFRTVRPNTTGLGHDEGGRNICMHSLAVHPKVQGCGLGKLIVKSYLQQINNSGVADRVSLICQNYLVSYYRRFGFKHLGVSAASFGGGGWNDMVFDLVGQQQGKKKKK